MKTPMKQPTHKQIIKFKEGEISLCPNCYCITKTILEKDKLICGKCRRGK
jgi:hypothetical protein